MQTEIIENISLDTFSETKQCERSENLIFHKKTVRKNIHLGRFLTSSMRTLPKFLPTPNFRGLVSRNDGKTFQNTLFHKGTAHPKTCFGWF